MLQCTPAAENTVFLLYQLQRRTSGDVLGLQPCALRLPRQMVKHGQTSGVATAHDASAIIEARYSESIHAGKRIIKHDDRVCGYHQFCSCPLCRHTVKGSGKRIAFTRNHLHALKAGALRGHFLESGAFALHSRGLVRYRQHEPATKSVQHSVAGTHGSAQHTERDRLARLVGFTRWCCRRRLGCPSGETLGTSPWRASILHGW